MSIKESSFENLFTSDGKVKRKVKFSEAFLRPVYQYTSLEIRNWQREMMQDSSEEKSLLLE